MNNDVRIATNDPTFQDVVRVTLTFVLPCVPLKPAVAVGAAMLLKRGLLSLLPVFLLFIFFQRRLIDGIATTGTK